VKTFLLHTIGSLLLLLVSNGSAAPPDKLQHQVDDAVARQVAPAMVVVAVRHGELLFEASAGLADPETGRPMTARTPLRQASVTKPYVATTLIRLADANNIALDTPIDALLPESILEPLTEAGYEPSRITLDHLLTHTAGLRDHSDSWRFLAVSLLLRNQAWTPLEQVERMADLGEPLWPPDRQFAYSDTGYVLLGQVVEDLAGKPLAAAVRENARFGDLGLQATWWELLETAPPAVEPTARQYMDGWDMSDLHPTVDLFGGGGLVATTLDTARFFDALFSKEPPGGLVMRDPDLRARLLGEGESPISGSYKRGISRARLGDSPAYFHTGYWGTAVYHLPGQALTIAGAVTDRNGMSALLQAIETAATEMAQ
jgi:D-alanyl-D-alanine carboxypeptidase